ncbi:MAG: DHHA1 domain-containing protein [Candidatus Nezhaarchaeales archaeon]
MDVWIFTHGDTDGLCSGALSLAANPGAQVFFTHPYGLLEDLQRAKDTDKVIICDIALSEIRLNQILQRFKAIVHEGALIYIDHHPLPEGISRNEVPGMVTYNLNASASEQVYSYFQSRLDPTYARIAIYGAIGDYLDNTPLIQTLLRKWDKRTLYLETGILVQGVEALGRSYDSKRRIVQDLSNNKPPSFNEDLVRLALQYTRKEEEVVKELKGRVNVEGKIAYILNFPFSLGKTAMYIRGLTDALVGIAGEERKGMIDMSLRTYNEKIDLNNILRHIAPRLGGDGGGHPMASGARIPKENFKSLIKELNKHLNVIHP